MQHAEDDGETDAVQLEIYLFECRARFAILAGAL
jgi:hypothetical protein